MNIQPEALRLAVDLDEASEDHDAWNKRLNYEAAIELRRLYAEVDRLSYQLAYPDNFLKEPEQEPVAIADGTFNHNCPVGTPLYTSPPSLSLAQRQRSVKPLTDEEIASIIVKMNGNEPTALFWRDLTRVIEAKLREKTQNEVG